VLSSRDQATWFEEGIRFDRALCEITPRADLGV
jgi:hypothetical protein